MYMVLGIRDSKVISKEVTSKNNALNLMSVIQGGGDSAFLLDKTFPSAYPCYHKAYDLHLRYQNTKDIWETVEILEKLEQLEIKQGINATKELLNR